MRFSQQKEPLGKEQVHETAPCTSKLGQERSVKAYIYVWCRATMTLPDDSASMDLSTGLISSRL